MKNYPQYIQFNGRTQLHSACLNHKFELVNELIKKGININKQDADGQTALYLAKNKEIIKILLAAGANPDLQERYAGYTALMDTLIWPDKNKFALLVNITDTNIKTIFGYTSLMLAARNNDLEAIGMLIRAGSDPYILNNEGEDFYDLLPLASQEIIKSNYPDFFKERGFHKNSTSV
jgi:ankyrin repeat protein